MSIAADTSTHTKRLNRVQPVPNNSQSGPINPKFLQPGITGADLTLPIFDGTSANPHDHLIDLDTPSMESCPDVRVYFALVGSVITKDNLSPPKDHAERVLSDARLVRQGREYLKAARDRGDGFWLSPKRDILANNKPGSKWYRLPTAEIVYDISNHRTDTFEEEGYMHDSEKAFELPINYSSVMMTNIRIPILWADAYKEGVIPGTEGWDESIMRLYGCTENLHYLIKSSVIDFDDLIFNLMVSSASADDSEVCSRSEVERLIRRDWPDLKWPWFRSDYYDNPKFTDLPNNTMDQFLMRSE